jgi:N-terminal domain of anti-restriction factor ArdC
MAKAVGSGCHITQHAIQSHFRAGLPWWQCNPSHWPQPSGNGYEDPRWMTYKQGAEHGWQARRGEKGTQIEFWEAVAIPIQDLDPVAPSSGEHKQVAGEGIQFQVLAHQCVQPVKTVAHVARDQAKIHPHAGRQMVMPARGSRRYSLSLAMPYVPRSSGRRFARTALRQRKHV